MPAASDLPRTFRPLGPRIVGIVVGASLFGLCAITWFFAFSAKTRSEFTWDQSLTLLLIGLGIAAVLHALIRSRITATETGLIVVNGYRKRVFEWAQIVAIRLPAGAPWVTLDLADGSACSAMGIQGSDGGRARAQVRTLRALLTQHTDA